MRIESKKKIKIKNKIIGGKKFLICLPLLSKNKEELLKDTKELLKSNPDLLEWRIDYFDEEILKDRALLEETMEELAQITKNIPLILTCRHIEEGGNKKISQNKRKDIIKRALELDLADIIDLEMMNDLDFIKDIKNLVKKENKYLILSYHNFDSTEDIESIINKIIQGENLGGDISKIAYMANSYDDSLNLLTATNKSREKVDIPVIGIAMGEYGKLSRVVGGFFGSDISFASGKESSAPGQLTKQDIEKILEILK